LPKGATPIDFAYRIHSGVGERCIGAIVNDQIVPLDHELEDGDVVKINTGKEPNPNKDWLKFVKTPQAKNKIKSFFSKQDKAYYIETGREMIERDIRRRKLSINDVLSPENINKVVRELKLADEEDMYLSVGSLRFTASYIVNVILEDKKNATDIYLEKFENNTVRDSKAMKGDIIVDGTDDILVTFAKCCKPVKGDEIVGYITKGEGIQVHRKDCPNIKEANRLIDVKWNMNSGNEFYTDIEVKIERGSDRLLDIITVASQKNVSISQVKTKEEDAYLIYDLTLKLTDIVYLNNFLNELSSIKYVKEVNRKIS
jgi:GTP pyrophosphokinase